LDYYRDGGKVGYLQVLIFNGSIRVGVNEGRVESPLLSIEGWDKLLKKNSFCGNELVVRDYDESGHMCSLLISKPTIENKQLNIPIEILSPLKASIARRLSQELQNRGLQSENVSWSEFSVSQEKIYIVLDLQAHPILVNPSGQDFCISTSLLTQAKHVLWITLQEDTDLERLPERGLITGLSRVARFENQSLELVLLDLESSLEQDDITVFDIIEKITIKSFLMGIPPKEFEYTWRNNRLLIQRLLPISGPVPSLRKPNGLEKEILQNPYRSLKLQVTEPGLLDSMVFVTDEMVAPPLEADELEVEAKTFGINFKDVFIALGQMQDQAMIGEFAGTVSKIGSNLQSSFKSGDRVCGFLSTPFASHPRVQGLHVYPIPDDISFADAASIPVVFLTAYWSLVKIARLSPNDKILIHSASGGVGQAAIQIAQDIGAEIFATVGSAEKRHLLIDKYNIHPSHIFSNRTSAFKDGILTLTKEKGVDVILNSLSGDLLQDTWDCIAMFGTFIEIGKTDIRQNSQLSMRPFDRNVNFSSVDLVLLGQHRPKVVQEAFATIMSMFKEKRLQPVFSVTTYPLEDIEDAFRLIQARKHMGKVVLDAEKASVKTLPAGQESLKLVEDGTYIIAGGRGSLGKELVQFMTFRGARNIVLLSRRGQDYDKTIMDKQAKTTVHKVKCDISDPEAVKNKICWIKQNLPPVRGVIQAAMLLKVS
jgi:NADPH:quinone reductase-like Zn-dependent oxidoreductase